MNLQEAIEFLDGVRDNELTAADVREQRRSILRAVLAQNVDLARKLQQAQERISGLLVQAQSDPLTEVQNRTGFEDGFAKLARRAARTGEPIAMLLVDVDGLKKINDRGGHVAGDAAIVTVADALKKVASREGDVIGRMGGDEFAVALANANLESGRERAERLRDVLKQSAFRGPDGAPVTVSVGVASSAQHGMNRDVLFEAADAAMYVAKGGRDAVAVEGTGALVDDRAADADASVETDDERSKDDSDDEAFDFGGAVPQVLAGDDDGEEAGMGGASADDHAMLAEDEHLVNELIAGILHAAAPAAPIPTVAAASVVSNVSGPAPRRRMRMG